MKIEHEENGWSRYENLVLYRLDKQDEMIKTLTKKVDKIALKLAALGTAAGWMAGWIYHLVIK